ncbi:TetR family transcriptional regulator [Streptomyces sp. RKND-216]|uniref:TetR/AcrR family transcriptional regulator n=1 Tax=Streptomyces sp. RKND-216 TaxID=2562581 RepID=UPI00109D85F1|nr:TetR family transcriptional regulator [Streptomyces sp. RKND-216]THA27014.1 TetR family transcriptional regulator [Streptomyces sp. RKND-216]
MAPTRRHDPDRRTRMVDAAIRVVDAHGIAGLSHRRVAAEADVPLGSTTYHFASREDLLIAALRRVGDRWLADVDAWERALPADAPLGGELARLVQESLTGGRARARLEYELYLAALRHDAVQPVAAECVDGLAAILRRRTPDDATARALAALTDGLTLQLLLTGRTPDGAELRTLLAPLADAGVNPSSPTG